MLLKIIGAIVVIWLAFAVLGVVFKVLGTLLIIGGAVLLAIAYVVIKGGDYRYYVKAEFKDVGGLRPNSSVKVAGVPGGSADVSPIPPCLSAAGGGRRGSPRQSRTPATTNS